MVFVLHTGLIGPRIPEPGHYDGPNEYAAWRVEQGFPRDGFFANGALGQNIYIVPSERTESGALHEPPQSRQHTLERIPRQESGG
jgi:hypothetical protein